MVVLLVLLMAEGACSRTDNQKVSASHLTGRVEDARIALFSTARLLNKRSHGEVYSSEVRRSADVMVIAVRTFRNVLSGADDKQFGGKADKSRSRARSRSRETMPWPGDARWNACTEGADTQDTQCNLLA